METLLPFSEVAKLERGNANLRPPCEKKRPFKEMMETAGNDPECFHLKNRGITYLCDRFEFDNSARKLTISIPDIPKDRYDNDGVKKFGIADGGHTYKVIEDVVGRLVDYKETPEWMEPFVRVHFVSGEGSEEAQVEGIVEALNTSSQVQQFTLDEYQDKFEPLKEALTKSGFDTSLVTFRENEEKEWHVIEIIQRLACFLKDRWVDTHPASMYKSKSKALELYTNESTQKEFFKLFDVIKDVVILPEYIESRFSDGVVNPKSFGKLGAVKVNKKPVTRAGTPYTSKHSLDLAALLPMAAAFRECLQLKGDRYCWRIDPKKVFERCADSLHKALVNRIKQVSITSHLGTDMEYWGACSQIVMRTVMGMWEEQAAGARV
jgi:hypothetical protein